MSRIQPRCTCHDAIGLNIKGMHCPRHSDVVSTTAVMTPGRVHHAEPVTLRPIGATSTLLQPRQVVCSCDAPMIFGHDTGCEYHPAPILADPLQLLVAAVQLIPDQPTTEQWHTITKAIADLVPSSFRSA